MKNKLFVSVIIPIRNEEKYISELLESIISQTYPKENLEVLIVDGMSDDKTREILSNYMHKYSFFKILNNPFLYTPHALNIGLKNSKGDIIIRMDCHSVYPNNYIERLVFWQNKLNADNVGGYVKTINKENNLKSIAISKCLSHPFGVGNSYFRIINPQTPIMVDTVPFGCFPKKIFEKIGMFDEDLIRNQDDEFNARIIKHGGKIYLVPDVQIVYYSRDSFIKLWKMYYQYGYFKPLVNLKLIKPATIRQFVPLLFVSTLSISLVLSLIYPLFLKIFWGIFIFYSTLNVIFSIILSKKNLKLISLIYISFLIIHLSYGVGYLAGLIDFVLLKKHLKKRMNIEITR